MDKFMVETPAGEYYCKGEDRKIVTDCFRLRLIMDFID